MPTKAKVEAVELLKDKFERSSIVITTNYSGLPVSEMTELRHALREAEVEYRIIKNSLAYIAADQAGKPEIKRLAMKIRWLRRRHCRITYGRRGLLLP